MPSGCLVPAEPNKQLPGGRECLPGHAAFTRPALPACATQQHCLVVLALVLGLLQLPLSAGDLTTVPNTYQMQPISIPGPLYAGADGANVNALSFGSVTFIPGGTGAWSTGVVVGLPGQTADSVYLDTPYRGPTQIWRFLVDGPRLWSPCLLKGDMYAPLGHTAVRNGSHGAQLVVFGGVRLAALDRVSEASAELLSIDPMTCVSRRLVSPSAKRPPARMFHSAELWTEANKMLIVGGCAVFTSACISGCAQHGLHSSLDVWALDLSTLAWEQLSMAADSPQPQPRYLAAASLATSAGGSAVLSIFLGTNQTLQGTSPNCNVDGGNLQTSWQLDLGARPLRWAALPTTSVVLPSPPPPTLAADGSCIVANAGQITVFSSASSAWTTLAVPPQDLQPQDTAFFSGLRCMPYRDGQVLCFGSDNVDGLVAPHLQNTNQSMVWTLSFALDSPFNQSACSVAGSATGTDLSSSVAASQPPASSLLAVWNKLAVMPQLAISGEVFAPWAVFTAASQALVTVFSSQNALEPVAPTMVLQSVETSWLPLPPNIATPQLSAGVAVPLADSDCILLAGGSDMLVGVFNFAVYTFCLGESSARVPLPRGETLVLPAGWAALPVANASDALPVLVSAVAGQLEGSSIVVYGGTKHGFAPSQDTWRLHLETGAGAAGAPYCWWESLSLDQSPTATISAAAAVANISGQQALVLVGGMSGLTSQVVGDVWYYSLHMAGWRELVPSAAHPAYLRQLQLPLGGGPAPAVVLEHGRPQNRTQACLARLSDTLLLLAFGVTAIEPNSTAGQTPTYVEPYVFAWLLDLANTAWIPLPNTATSSNGYYIASLRQQAAIQCQAIPSGATPGGAMQLVRAFGVPIENLQLESIFAGCPPGSYSPNFPAVPCTICPIGTYAEAASANCTACPGKLATYAEGSTSLRDCAACQDHTCHGHGNCYVQGSASGVQSTVCHCTFAYTGSTCTVPWLQWAGIGAVGAMLLAFVVYRLVKRRLGRMQTYTALQELLLDKANAELEELHRVFEIAADDVQLERRIDGGVGAFGEVWLGTFNATQVAVKILLESAFAMSPETADEFQREIAALKTLRHRHVVLFYGAGVMDRGEGERPFLVTEYLARGSLRGILCRHRDDQPLSWAQRVSFARQTADGMAFLHTLSPPRIHRDLKTANLLVAHNWTVKVADFGTARLLEQLEEGEEGHEQRGRAAGRRAKDAAANGSERQLTQHVGTPVYSAPEILSGGSYTLAVDVYSFGIVMFEIARRETPFEDIKGPLWKVTNHIIAEGRPVASATAAPPAVLPEAYSQLMEACWAQDPGSRPSFPVVRDTLARYLASLE